MRFQTEVGERERHRIEFRLDRFWVDVTICLDGIRIVRDLRLLAWRPIKRYRFDVGQEERHEVTIEVARPRWPWQPYRCRVLIDGARHAEYAEFEAPLRSRGLPTRAISDDDSHGPGNGGASAAVDAALADYLRDASDANEERLAATGEAGFRRVSKLFNTPGSTWPEDLQNAVGSGREAVEALSSAVGVVARANPGLFMHGILTRRPRLGGRSPNLGYLVILRDITDERVPRLVLPLVTHRKWLVRYHAVRALAPRDDPESIAAVENALHDPEPIVRCEAIMGIEHRDRAQALQLYRRLLEDGRINPLLRQDLDQRLGLTRGDGT